jgi:transposase
VATAAGSRRRERRKKQRLQAARLFARGATQAEVARRLGVSRVSAMRWYRLWHEGGRRRLEQTLPLGRRSRLGLTDIERIEAALIEGAESQRSVPWTLPRIATMIERVSGVRYHPGHVWRVLQGLGWSLQRPGRRGRGRDEDASAQWKRRERPRATRARGGTQS